MVSSACAMYICTVGMVLHLPEQAQAAQPFLQKKNDNSVATTATPTLKPIGTVQSPNWT